MLEVGINSYLDIITFDEIKLSDFIIDPNQVALDKDLINGTSLMDTLFLFKGEKADPLQSLEFPRVINNEIVSIEGDIELIASRITYYLLTDPSMFQKKSLDTLQQIKKEKMDVFETEYFELKGDTSVEFINKLDIHTQKLLEKYIRVDITNSSSSIISLITR